ncbi:hypothetical protein HOU66_gp08 [Pectobacterium phage Arno160]|uniref:Uncharacterized protein n=1 Tax=Pectobacterium phage Arno160 TaxID=2488835 RepID=A0A3G8F4I0_9CAUD|nr:hypothetical protein HOU66_gp08 [Pectobacterium phage Arno160]AZF88070.1 hypothetical protein Arno160_gp08 [Pectobacterium phage Arno160]
MNQVVFVCDGTTKTRDAQLTAILSAVSVAKFERRRNVSKEAHAKALEGLRREYSRKAAAVGMSLRGYCARFNVRLPC